MAFVLICGTMCVLEITINTMYSPTKIKFLVVYYASSIHTYNHTFVFVSINTYIIHIHTIAIFIFN